MSAEGQIKAFIDRILRLKEEQDVIGDDIREIYAEAKGMGFDKTAMGNVVAHLRKVAKKGSETVAEQGAIFDIYLAAYEGHAPAPARVRENIEKFDPTTGEILDEVNPRLVKQVVDGMQTEAGRAALVTAIDILIEQEEAEQDPVANVGEEATSTTAAASSDPASRADDESERQHSSTVGFADDCRTGGKEQSDASAAPVGDAAAFAHGIPALSEKASVAAQDKATVSHSDQRDSDREAAATRVGANEGGDDVDGGAVRADPKGQENIEPTGPVAERATHSPEEATKQRVNVHSQHEGANAQAIVQNECVTVVGTESGTAHESFPPRPMKSLPYASCFPELTKAEYGRLEFSITGIGVSKPIIRMGDVIIDGWNRYNIARSLGIRYPVEEYSGNDVLLDVIAWQRQARQFTPAQERQIADRLSKEIPHRAADIRAAFSLEKEMA